MIASYGQAHLESIYNLGFFTLSLNLIDHHQIIFKPGFNWQCPQEGKPQCDRFPTVPIYQSCNCSSESPFLYGSSQGWPQQNFASILEDTSEAMVLCSEGQCYTLKVSVWYQSLLQLTHIVTFLAFFWHGSIAGSATPSAPLSPKQEACESLWQRAPALSLKREAGSQFVLLVLVRLALSGFTTRFLHDYQLC